VRAGELEHLVDLRLRFRDDTVRIRVIGDERGDHRARFSIGIDSPAGRDQQIHQAVAFVVRIAGQLSEIDRYRLDDAHQ